MFNLFVKQSKSQKAIADEYKHSPALSFFYGIIILGFTLLSFSLHFEFRLIDILSKTSMRDDTQTLSRFEKYLIKRKADEQEAETKVHFGYQISDETLDLPKLAKQTLFLRVIPSKQFVAVYLPEKYKKYEPMIEKNIHDCLFTQAHELKVCLYTTMKIFQITHDSLNDSPFKSDKPYTYSDSFNDKAL